MSARADVAGAASTHLRRVAAVDVGTNSVRLLVAEPDGAGGLRRLERTLAITRLGEGVDRDGRLADVAVTRTTERLAGFRRRWQELGCRRAVIGATSAVRDAADRDRFLDAAEHATGVRPRVLSGAEEADLAFRGATFELDRPGPHLVVDLGGGSTELVAGATGVTWSHSLQLGCVRLAERCFAHDPPTPAEVASARATADDELAAVDRADHRPRPDEAAVLVGVAGTVTTLAALHLGLRHYDAEAIHRTELPAQAVADLADRLVAMTAEQRRELAPVVEGREDVLHAGALVLDALLRRWGHQRVMASEADGLDGLALAALEG